MPAFEAVGFDPPAAVASVILRDGKSGKSVSNVVLLLDTGADVTLIPRVAIEQSKMEPVIGIEYDLIGFDGTRQKSQAIDLDMIFEGRTFRGRYLLTDSEMGVIGRDVLSCVAILFDGPRRMWTIVDQA